MNYFILKYFDTEQERQFRVLFKKGYLIPDPCYKDFLDLNKELFSEYPHAPIDEYMDYSGSYYVERYKFPIQALEDFRALKELFPRAPFIIEEEVTV